jgi:hypothetical protein
MVSGVLTVMVTTLLERLYDKSMLSQDSRCCCACHGYCTCKKLIELGYTIVFRMVLELIKVHLPTFVFGLVLGILITQLRVKLTLQKRDIGKLIDLAFIERNISQLKSLTSNLDKLVEQISENGVELRQQIKLTEDIEFKFGSLQSRKLPLSKLDLGIKPIDDNIRS